jgi:hypothetical protein
MTLAPASTMEGGVNGYDEEHGGDDTVGID